MEWRLELRSRLEYLSDSVSIIEKGPFRTEFLRWVRRDKLQRRRQVRRCYYESEPDGILDDVVVQSAERSISRSSSEPSSMAFPVT